MFRGTLLRLPTHPALPTFVALGLTIDPEFGDLSRYRAAPLYQGRAERTGDFQLGPEDGVEGEMFLRLTDTTWFLEQECERQQGKLSYRVMLEVAALERNLSGGGSTSLPPERAFSWTGGERPARSPELAALEESQVQLAAARRKELRRRESKKGCLSPLFVCAFLSVMALPLLTVMVATLLVANALDPETYPLMLALGAGRIGAGALLLWGIADGVSRLVLKKGFLSAMG